MATQPGKEWNQPLQPGRTQPEPTQFPDPNPARTPPQPDTDPLAPPE
ncbi:MAG TPA: hypothetical protein VEX35_12750 [Allosphingosinicella sp.]|nr:hypothetical protein [Allosphingosinicella sp.]